MNAIVEEHFGNGLVFMCYEFMTECHAKPTSFDQLFDFMRVCKVRNIVHEIVVAKVKASANEE